MKLKTKRIITIVASIVVALLVGIAGGKLTATVNEKTIEIEVPTAAEQDGTITLSEEQMPALVDNKTGDTEEVEAPTVIAVDGGDFGEDCGENEECGQGSYAPTDSPQIFKDYVYGKCWDEDGHFGSQCWDLGQLFWTNYAGRTLSTCGTGAAKGIWTCKDQNAGDEFELITDPAQLQAGDWLIFNNGKWGHVGMALGTYNNGYITLLGTNQGGNSCSGGGSTANIINISLIYFSGAFRPKSYIKNGYKPVPVSNCVKWHLERGDTLGKIMLECENTIRYGKAMDDYAKTWYSLVYKPGQSVYDGWYKSGNGVGLYAGDDIEHRTGGN